MRPRRSRSVPQASLPQFALAVLLANPIALSLVPITNFPLPAVAQAQAREDRKAEADRLLQQGIQQYQTSQYEAALQSWAQALTLYRAIPNRNGEANVLNNLGLAYYSLSQYEKAIAYYEQARPIFQQVKNRNGEANVLNNLGIAYDSLSQYEKAIAYYEQARPIFQQVKDRKSEAKVLMGLGTAYYSLSQVEKAIAYYEQARPIFQQVKDRNGEANVLMNLGNAYQSLSQYERAIAYYEQALPILQQVKDRAGEGTLFSNLGILFARRNDPELAIVFYKQSVSVRESIRQDIRKLDRDLQASYTQSVAGTYRNLADLLLQQNRVMEAMQVLDLLKVQELQDYLKDIKGNELTAQGLPLLPQEREIVQAFKQNPAINKTISNPTVTRLVGQLRQTAAAQNLTLPAYQDLQARIQKLGICQIDCVKGKRSQWKAIVVGNCKPI